MTPTDQPYEQWHFHTSNPQTQEMLIALLADHGFEAFEQQADALLAAAPAGRVEDACVAGLAGGLGVKFSKEIIQPRNWNAQWEADYQPVVVPGWCSVRAHFHPASGDTPHEVIITPKMSFGTGHHATTWLMLKAMQGYDFGGKTVLDFGTGTGVLAILAAKLGAARVLAIDNDPWSVENAQENVVLNSVERGVRVVGGSLQAARGAAFDVILANINRHVLLACMSEMRALLSPGGMALISGLLVEDEPVIAEAAQAAGFKPTPAQARNGWIAMRVGSQM